MSPTPMHGRQGRVLTQRRYQEDRPRSDMNQLQSVGKSLQSHVGRGQMGHRPFEPEGPFQSTVRKPSQNQACLKLEIGDLGENRTVG